MTAEEIVRYLQGAPAVSPYPAPENLRGYWVPDGLYLCAECAGRIMGRGIAFTGTPVWADRPEPYGTCAGCNS